MKEQFNNTAHTKEGTNGEKLEEIQTVAIWGFEKLLGWTVFEVNLLCFNYKAREAYLPCNEPMVYYLALEK